MMRRGAAILAFGVPCLLVTGCRRTEALLPLEANRTWTYTVRTPFQTYVEPVTVTGRTSVGPAEGWILSGAMGTSWLGWDRGTLWTTRLSGTAFWPPLPLAVAEMSKVSADKAPPVRNWSGTLEAFGKRRPARGVLRQGRDRLLIGGARVWCARSDLTVMSGGHRLEVSTWFAPGNGIVKQEQRTDRTLIVAIKLLDGE